MNANKPIKNKYTIDTSHKNTKPVFRLNSTVTRLRNR